MLKSLTLIISAIFVIGPISHSVYGQAERSKTYGVLIDNHRPLEKRFDQVKLFSKRVVDQVHKQGPVQLFSFRSTQQASNSYYTAIGTLGIDWTQDEDILTRYIEGLGIVRGRKELFGAIRSVAESLNANSANSKDAPSDKIIILITDGEHRMEWIGSSETETDDEQRKRDSKLRKYLKDSGIKVYAIGITGELDTGDERRLRAENFLGKLTKETGGKVVFSRSKNAEIDKLVNKLVGL